MDKTCAKCGAALTGDEGHGDLCNECLDKALRRSQALDRVRKNRKLEALATRAEALRESLAKLSNDMEAARVDYDSIMLVAKAHDQTRHVRDALRNEIRALNNYLTVNIMGAGHSTPAPIMLTVR